MSLDAPVVALTWQAFFARNLGVALDWKPRVVLALSVWLAYAGDRWLDGFSIPASQTVLPRHRFAQRHRRSLGSLWLMVLVVTALLAWFGISRAAFWSGVILFSGIGMYFALTHLPGTLQKLPRLKEPSVAILFSLGTALFVYAELPRLTLGVLLPLIFWAGLCFLNCYAIGCWEAERDQAQQQASLLTQWPVLKRWFVPLAAVFAIVATGVLLSQPVFPRAYIAVSISATILILLDWFAARLSVDALRLLADLALMTPVLFMLLLPPP